MGFRARRLIILGLLVIVTVAVIAVVARGRSGAAVLQTSAAGALRVRGDQIVFGPGAGHVVQLRGINRSGTEYQCIQQEGSAGEFDSPTPYRADSDAMVTEMLSWGIDVVRLPLNEGCWLGINSPTGSGGAAYRRAVEAEVRVLNAHHLFVILTLQWNSAGDHYSDSPLPMADADHSPAFWRSVATTFRGDGWLMFDLFSEPHNISWSCWLHGCLVPASKFSSYAYRAAGMQQLIDAVRSAHNAAPIILSGNTYALDLTGYYTHTPTDPDHALVLSLHTYGERSPCVGPCRVTVADADQHVAVLADEIGEFDCGGGYLASILPFLDGHDIGYLAWAWDAVSPGVNGWSCANGPSLIDNYGGTPTPYGAAFRDHLLARGTALRP